MSEAITFMLAGSFQHSSSSVFKATRNGVTQTITVAAGWYRTWLASTGGGGTSHTDPKEYLAYVKGLMNTAFGVADWNVRMGSSGLVEITNTAFAWSTTWDGTGGTDKIARSVLGYTSNASGSAGVYGVAALGPCFVVAGASRRSDTYWQTKQTTAVSELESGVVSALGTGTPRATRSFDVLFVPADTGSLTALSFSPPYSPAYPDASRFAAPMASPPTTLDYAYSWHDFVNGMVGRELGACITTNSGANLGTFALTQAGTVTTYEKCYLTGKCAGNLRTSAAQENWHHRKHVLGIELSFVSQASL